jgi:hypothetical protein
MHTELDHLVKLFRGVRNIRGLIKQYAMAADMSETSLDDLTTGFAEEYGVQIRFGLVPELSGNLLRGMYIREENLVSVYIDEGLPDQWRRYVAVKELCHLILGDAEYMTQDPVKLIELMIFEETTPQDGNAPLDLVSDMWARRAAHEFLFPMECRAAAKEKIAAGTETNLSISRQFNVPQHLIEECLRSHYDEVCKQAWAGIDNEHYTGAPKIDAKAAE